MLLGDDDELHVSHLCFFSESVYIFSFYPCYVLVYIFLLIITLGKNKEIKDCRSWRSKIQLYPTVWRGECGLPLHNTASSSIHSGYSVPAVKQTLCQERYWSMKKTCHIKRLPLSYESTTSCFQEKLISKCN